MSYLIAFFIVIGVAWTSKVYIKHGREWNTIWDVLVLLSISCLHLVGLVALLHLLAGITSLFN